MAVAPIFEKAVFRISGNVRPVRMQNNANTIATVTGLISFLKSNAECFTAPIFFPHFDDFFEVVSTISTAFEVSLTPTVHSISWSIMVNTEIYSIPLSGKILVTMGIPIKPIFPKALIAE